MGFSEILRGHLWNVETKQIRTEVQSHEILPVVQKQPSSSTKYSTEYKLYVLSVHMNIKS